MRYYLIAGEASGDLHGSNLMKAIKDVDPKAEFRFWGGDQMAAVGDGLVRHFRDIAYMGFIEVIRNLPTIMKGLSACKEDILQFDPHALILIDYPGFNLRIAKWAHSKNINVQYYISPQVWAWKAHRAESICESSNKLYVILPFEKKFYADRNLEVAYVGHPLLDAIAQFKPNENFRTEYDLPKEKDLVAILPGSRKQEVNILLPIMLTAARQHPDKTFVIAGVSSLSQYIYQGHFEQLRNVHIVIDCTYDLLAESHTAIVTSGTATLETALFDVPQVVCYRGNAINYAIARRIVDIDYISLVNLIADKPIVQELVQKDFTPGKLAFAFSQIIEGEQRKRMKKEYAELREVLGNAGASSTTAQLIWEDLLSKV